MRNILRLRVLGILLLALGLFGGTVASVSAAPATPPSDSGVGSLTVAAFWSDQVVVPTITEGWASGDAEGGADKAEASFELYINGDTTATPYASFTTTDGNAVVIDNVPVTVDNDTPHLLVLTSFADTSYSFRIWIYEGFGTFTTVLIPSGVAPGQSDSGSLVLSSFGADQVDGAPQFLVSQPIDAFDTWWFNASADDLYDAGYTGVYRVDREFLIYLNQDTGSDPYSLQTIGGTALFDNLPEGTHTLVDAQSGYSTSFSIVPGGITTVVAVFPEGFGDTGDDDDPDTESPDGYDRDGYDRDGYDRHGHGHGYDHDGDGKGGDAYASVTKLPSTGQTGNQSDSSTLAIVLGAMSLLALAGGYAWRQRRTA